MLGTHNQVQKKSQLRELQDSRAIEKAAWLWRANDCPVAVVTRGRFVGVVHGNSRTHQSWFVEAWRCTGGNIYDTYDQAVQRNASGKHFGFHWYKFKGAGTIGNWYDLWPCLGKTGPGSYGGTARTANNTFDKSTAGGLFHGPDVSPNVKYMKRQSGFWTGGSSRVEAHFMYDRVLTYEACTMSASNQAMTNTLTAQRWATNGDRGLQIFATADTVHSATAANLTQLQYTNQAGTTLRSIPTTPTLAKIVSIAAPTTTQGARVIIQAPTTATRSDAAFLPLAAGDLGVQAIANYTFSAAPTGTICFALVFPYLLCPDMGTIGTAYDVELVHGVEALSSPRVYDSACLGVGVYQQPASAGTIEGWSEMGW